ncbi:hypothetical protein V1509DRAFT_636862 [Lipomyces kononenkoae]
MWFMPLTYFLKAISLRDRTITKLRNTRESMPHSMQEFYDRLKERIRVFSSRVVYSLYTGASYRVLVIFVAPYTAITSCDMRYPFVGIFYFLYHPVLWPSFVRIVGPLFLVLVSVMGVWFTVAYPPQAIIFVLMNGPVGLVSSAVLVCRQAYMIYSTVARMFFLKHALRDCFDMVLKLKGLEDLLANANVDFPEEVDVEFYGRMQQSVFYKLRNRYHKFVLRMTSPYVLLKALILLPIQFIPIIGPLIIALVNSVDTARAAQGRYFQLKGWSPRQVRVFTRRRYGSYWTFGAVAGTLETIPLLDMFFGFTNATGAALWAAKLEKKARRRSAKT